MRSERPFTSIGRIASQPRYFSISEVKEKLFMASDHHSLLFNAADHYKSVVTRCQVCGRYKLLLRSKVYYPAVPTAAAASGPAAVVAAAAAAAAATDTTAVASAEPGVDNCQQAFDHYNSLWPMASTFERSQRGYFRLSTNRV